MIAHLKPVLQLPLPRPNGSIKAQSSKESTVCARMWNNAMEKYKHKNSMSKKEKKGKAHSNTNRTTTGSPQHGTAWRNKFNRGIIERNPPNSDLPVAAAGMERRSECHPSGRCNMGADKKAGWEDERKKSKTSNGPCMMPPPHGSTSRKTTHAGSTEMPFRMASDMEMSLG